MPRDQLEGLVTAQADRIVDLAEQLRVSNEEKATLATELAERQREIAEGAEALAQTADKLNGNGEPLVHAPVLLVRREEARIGEPKEYVVGVHVRFSATAQTEKVALGIGTIEKLGKKPGFAEVKFDKGKETCFIGLPAGTEPEEGTPSAVEVEIVKLATVVIKHDGRNMDVPLPPHLTIKPGDTVRMGKAQNIVDVTSVPATGPICRVKHVHADTVEVESGGNTLVVLKADVTKVEKDDRVILDLTSSVCLVNLGQGENNHFQVGETGVDWDDIGGQDEAKRLLQEAIIDPVTDRELDTFLSIKPSKGFLLYGPPGNAKTMLAKAVATAVAKAYTGIGTAKGLVSLKGPELLMKWVGEAEAQSRALFAYGRRFKKEHGYPLLVVLDEGEALLRKRGTSISSDVNDSIVTTWCAEMDGMDENGIILLIISNKPDMIDPAILRDGRIDTKIELKRPNQQGAETIFGIHLRKAPVYGATKEDLARRCSETMFSERYRFAELDVATPSGERQVKPFGLGQIISGAMIAGVVNLAKRHTKRRCKAAGNKTGQGDGVRLEDLEAAIAAKFHENLILNHQDAADDYVRDEGGRVVGIRRMRAGSAN